MLKALTLIAALALPALVLAQAKVPETVADHLAMAKEYQEKAAAWRKEAAYHREMAESYKKLAAPGSKGATNPWVKKMEKHCRAIIADAEKLAADADEAAKFHTLRAKELEGK